MGWIVGFVIIALLSFIYDLVEKGESRQRKNDEKEALAHKLREEQIDNDRIQLLNENLKLANQNQRVVSKNVGLNQYLSNEQLQIGLLAIAVGVILIILYFKLVHFN